MQKLFRSQEEAPEKESSYQLNETLNDFNIGNDTNGDANKNDTSEPQNCGFTNNLPASVDGENSSSHNQVFERSFPYKIRKERI